MQSFWVVLAFLFATGSTPAIDSPSVRPVVVVDDFQHDTPGAAPAKWRFLTSRDQRFRPLAEFMDEDRHFTIHEENGRRFARGFTRGRALRISMPTQVLDWNLKEHPNLAWEWRALRLPEGAREDRVNDTGGAVYVTFDRTDWLGRPQSIKYTYSTLLPVGTVVRTGNVRVIVASSGLDGTGRWKSVERNVPEDYRAVFRGDPPEEPFTITLWSDSDDTESIGEVDFDNIVLKR